MKASAAADDVEQLHLTERKGLEEALSHLREGDALVVWRLDRLGRSLRDLIDRVTQLNDPTTGRSAFAASPSRSTPPPPGGKLIFHIFGALAEFERDIIRERTNAGLAAVRSRGNVGGRRRSLSQKDITLVKKLYADKSTAIADICRSFNISRRTLQRYVKGK
jgi:DNA invertase Pin-like site-specific DNA recombinase